MFLAYYLIVYKLVGQCRKHEDESKLLNLNIEHTQQCVKKLMTLEFSIHKDLRYLMQIQ